MTAVELVCNGWAAEAELGLEGWVTGLLEAKSAGAGRRGLGEGIARVAGPVGRAWEVRKVRQRERKASYQP